jgi:hypothetical protein
MRLAHYTLPLVLLLGSAGCPRRVRFEDQVLTTPEVRYRVGEVPEDWRRVRLAQNDLAFFSDDTGHIMGVNSVCEGHGDPSLEVLTRHLLMGFTERRRLSEERVVLDEREALRSRWQAKLDGVPVELLFIVLKKDECVYDFSYVAPLGRFEERVADFEALVAGFQTEPS